MFYNTKAMELFPWLSGSKISGKFSAPLANELANAVPSKEEATKFSWADPTNMPDNMWEILVQKAPEFMENYGKLYVSARKGNSRVFQPENIEKYAQCIDALDWSKKSTWREPKLCDLFDIVKIESSCGNNSNCGGGANQCFMGVCQCGNGSNNRYCLGTEVCRDDGDCMGDESKCVSGKCQCDDGRDGSFCQYY